MAVSRSGSQDANGAPPVSCPRRLKLDTEMTDSSREDSEGWVSTYMDLITLLLTLFILLLSYADRQSGEYDELTQAMADATSSPFDSGISPIELPQIAPPDPFELLQQRLRHQLEMAGLEEKVEIIPGEGKVDIQLSEQIMFASGQAELGEYAEDVLHPLLEVLREERYMITVEGHTDNLPITSERFPSNWELSSARATSVVRYLILEGIAPERLRATGYANTRPIGDNSQSAGRRKNRRVTLSLTSQPGLGMYGER